MKRQRVFRFSLKSLLGAALLIGPITLLVPLAVRKYDSYQLASFASSCMPVGATSNAVSEPVHNVQIVLVRTGDTFGVFIPRLQDQDGNTLSYEFHYREGPDKVSGTFFGNFPKRFLTPYSPLSASVFNLSKYISIERCHNVRNGTADNILCKMAGDPLHTAIAQHFRTVSGAGIMVPKGGPSNGRTNKAEAANV